MTKYTDEDVDAVALAIRNAAFTGSAVTHIGQCGNCGRWRDAARAALAARDALFETVAERWEVRWPVRRHEPNGAHDAVRAASYQRANAEADKMRASGFVGVVVVSVTTKRRKRA